ncbi:alpha/beta fold hydrolase [Mycobacterium yunnanensis]|uniref:Alpha/beta fold hydrolase n=1 Tax=Mycobacterium yunnanensis TaxID=368477 RepID=A0A9X3C605_9MYCO|nr:alpha/beta hydrolase [Mycobacterium yunnanensis]MCV7424852.1 alpha/beta fold hydrolase [Mycobacterium yunnanensis]
MLIDEHVITVPLDHQNPDGRTVEIYAREISARGGKHLPYLLFLQGGPGNEAPRPTAGPPSPSWLERALQDYRVIMLDQRGTGRSTPYGTPGPGDAERLTHYRADAIVQDAEALRQHLGARTWSLLGQSFGGFCSLHYLTVAPDSLDEVYFTGGLPPVGRAVDDVYSGAYDMMRVLNRRYHERFPHDGARLRDLLDRCDAGEVKTPAGEPISRRLMRTIGHRLGMDGGAESVHHLLELDSASPAFRHDAAEMLPFGSRNPLYAILHESSYADGGATRWSADRVAPGDFLGESLLLTAEHIFPWHFEETAGLRPYADVARTLAEHDWPRLYDAEVLAQVDVPCAAVIYADDPYVLRGFSEETADLLPGMRRWLTNEYLHNGLRMDGRRVLDRLISLARG